MLTVARGNPRLWAVSDSPDVHMYNVRSKLYSVKMLQLNLFTTATLETEESGRCKEVAACREVLTPQVPRVANINFLLTTSADH